MSIDPAGREATISINERLDADDLDQLIRRLADLRRHMLPEVGSSPGDEPAVATAKLTALTARIGPNGACDMWIRDEGLGWVACHFPIEAVVILQDGFRLAVSSPPPDSSFRLAFDSATHVLEEW